MATPRYYYTFTVDDKQNAQIDHIARYDHITSTAAVRALFRERLNLVNAGWHLDDEDIMQVIDAIVRLDDKDYVKFKNFLEELLT